MEYDWKHGDAAMVVCSDGEERIALYGTAVWETQPVWRFPDGLYRLVERSIARPVAVLDPENVSQMERLAKPHIFMQPGNVVLIAEAAFPARLAELEEPEGVLAQVLDGDSNAWVQVSPGAWYPLGLPDCRPLNWDDLPKPLTVVES